MCGHAAEYDIFANMHVDRGISGMKAGERMLRKALQKLARRQTGKCVLMVQAQASVQVVMDAARIHMHTLSLTLHTLDLTLLLGAA